MATTDLFGAPVEPPRGRRYVRPRGYAGRPGTGPAGETCGGCEHAVRFGHWSKCGLAQAKWTSGRATDIRLRAPACERWEKARPQ